MSCVRQDEIKLLITAFFFWLIFFFVQLNIEIDILVPIDLFASLIWRGLVTISEGLWQHMTRGLVTRKFDAATTSRVLK